MQKLSCKISSQVSNHSPRARLLMTFFISLCVVNVFTTNWCVRLDEFRCSVTSREQFIDQLIIALLTKQGKAQNAKLRP